MKNFSNTYIFLFSLIMVVVVAAVLSLAALTLKPRQDRNVEIESKRNILSSLGIQTSVTDAEQLFEQYITESIAVNASGEVLQGVSAQTANTTQGEWPLYLATVGDKKFVVIPLEGKGLWGRIWGYVSLLDDFNTIQGVTFSHAGETPGLGAEISTEPFQNQFVGKKIFEASGRFVGIRVLKPDSYKPDEHSVDAVSGGTITSNGLRDMIFECLTNYQTYFEQNKTQ